MTIDERYEVPMRPLAIGFTLALQASSTLPAMASDTVCAENASVISIKVDGGRMEWGVTVVDGETSSKTLMSTISLHSDEGKMMFLLLKDAERPPGVRIVVVPFES